MFQWSITLTDGQVTMLVAFASVPDEPLTGTFHKVYPMIQDAWDFRAVRKLTECGLISIDKSDAKNTAWHITKKGRHIVSAIFEDADNLGNISQRNGNLIGEAVRSTRNIEKKEESK